MFSINPLRRRKQIIHPAQADLISAEDLTIKADFAHPAGRNQLKRNSLCPKDKSCSFSGAGNGARTRHLRLGKAALYQMSYSRILNLRTAHGIIMLCPADHLQKVPIGYSLQMERVMGLVPTISAWKANVLPLHYTRI